MSEPAKAAPAVLKTSELKPHPIASICPMMDENSPSFIAVFEDIKDNGLEQPIYMFEGMILDGRNRVRILQLLGKEELTYSQYRQYQGDNPIGFVLRMNVHRRHLNESQRALVAAKLTDLEPGTNQHTKQGTSIDVASKFLNVGRASIDRARAVLKVGHPSLVAAVQNGDVAVSKAAAEVKGATKPKATKIEKPSVSFTKHLELMVEALYKFGDYTHAEEYVDKGKARLDTVLVSIADKFDVQNAKDAT